MNAYVEKLGLQSEKHPRTKLWMEMTLRALDKPVRFSLIMRKLVS